jgi:hypothetical protein
MTVVRIPLPAVSVELLMRDVDDETPLMIEVRVLTAESRELLLMKLAVVVATFPLTVEVRIKELVEVDTVSVFEVDDATRLVRSVVVATPLMVVVRILPEVERAFDEITEDVAVTPLMIVVRVLPERDCVKELMMFAKEDEMPLTIVWKTLRDEEATFEVMMVDVAEDPPMLEVRVLPEEERELEVVRTLVVRELVVRELEYTPSVARRSAVKKDPVDVALVNDAESAVRREEKMFVLVALVKTAEDADRTLKDAEDAVREVAVVVARVEVPVTVSVPPTD